MSETGSKWVPDEGSEEQTQSDMPDVKGKDDFGQDGDPTTIPQATGEPTLPANVEHKQD